MARESLDFLHQLRSLEVPRDEEDPRYLHAFRIPDDLTTEAGTAVIKSIKTFFDEFGFVVVRDCLSPEACDASLAEVFAMFEEGTANKFNRNDESTWAAFPSSGLAQHGMPTRAPVFTRQFLLNRTNPNVHRVFAMLLGDDDLLVNHDRCGLLRPTTGLGRKEWRSKPSLHLDMSPWGDPTAKDTNLSRLRYGDRLNEFIFENNQVSYQGLADGGVHLQGVINFYDNFEEDGGFQCVPGFHKFHDQWAAEHVGTEFAKDSAERNSVQFSLEHPFQSVAIRVPMRAGSVVVWDQRLPHGTKPNNSGRLRCAQFLKMYPRRMVEGQTERLHARASTLKPLVRHAGLDLAELTPLAARLLGLDLLTGDEGKRKQPAVAREDREKPRKGGRSRVQGGGWGAKK